MYISGSDIPIILGLHSITPYELWLIKKKEAEVIQTEEMERGQDLEDFIRNQYAKKINLPKKHLLSNLITNDHEFLHYYDNSTYKFIKHELGLEIQHPTLSFLKGHLDDFNINTHTAIEFKSTRKYIITCPIKFQVQTAFYCILTNAMEAHIVILHNTLDLSIYVYRRNKNLENLILKKAINFYENNLIKGFPPSPRTLNDIKKQSEKCYNLLENDAFIADDIIKQKIEDYKKIKEELKEKEKQCNALQIDLLNQFKNHKLIIDQEGNALATYKFNKKATPLVDKQLLITHYPEIWEKVKINKIPTRKFKIKKRSKKCHQL